MANAEHSNIDYVNPGADDQDSYDVIGEKCSMATPPNTNLQRKIPLYNPSIRENDGNTISKRFKFLSDGEEYSCSLPTDMADYVNENTKKFIPDTDVRDPFKITKTRQSGPSKETG